LNNYHSENDKTNAHFCDSARFLSELNYLFTANRIDQKLLDKYSCRLNEGKFKSEIHLFDQFNLMMNTIYSNFFMILFEATAKIYLRFPRYIFIFERKFIRLVSINQIGDSLMTF